MGKKVQVIKDQFEKFTSLVKDQKSSDEELIVFNQEKPSRPDIIYHKSEVKHMQIGDSIDLIAEQMKNKNYWYKFQLHCKDFHYEPFFRFASDGSSHQNKHLPLKDQVVRTPHFNTFDEEGRAVAYQTPELEGVQLSDLRNMNKFFHLFCEECYLRSAGNIKPNIVPGLMGQTNLFDDDDDLLSHVKFDL